MPRIGENMPDNDDGTITPHKGNIFQDLAMRIKLILRLMADPRVNFLLKLIPFGSFVYLIFPDLAPGPIDDAAVLWLGLYLFVELCPPEVVAEHVAELNRTIPGQWHDPQNESTPEDVIEAEFRDEQ
jgi:hypothetical protein